MKTLYTALILVFFGFAASAQNLSESFQLPDQNTYGSDHFMAKEEIKLLPGFNYNSQNGSFKGEINNKLIQSPTVDLQGGPGEDIGSDGVVGATSKNYSVNSGSFSYSIPIIVAPGVGGMQPGLSIYYNQNGSSGLLGERFGISGTMAITRAGKNLYDDGEYQPISWTKDDYFYFMGQRLISINSNYPTSVEYRLKNNNRLRVIAYNISVTGPQYFKVFDENGTVQEYGNTPNAKCSFNKAVPTLAGVPESEIYGWYLNKATDVYANTIEYIYTSDFTVVNGKQDNIASFRLSAIHYGNGTALDGYVNFNYVSDIAKDFYMAGYKMVKNKKLEDITSGHKNKQLRRYHFDYQSTERSTRLDRITEFGSDNSTHFNSTVFSWNNENVFSENKSVDLGIFPRQTITGDFNGDGLTDILISNFELMLSNEEGDFNRISISNVGVADSKTTQVYDVDGDGKDDVVNHIQNGTTTSFVYYKSEGTHFTLVSTLVVNGTKQCLVGDMDGDGIPELVSYDLLPETQHINLYQYDRVSGKFVYKTNQFINKKIISIDYGSFYGDGNKQLYIDLESRMDIYLYKNTLTKAYTESVFPLSEKKYVGDFNGDGISDILCIDWVNRLFFFKGTGKEFIQDQDFLDLVTTGIINEYNEIIVSDYNGDGILDILTYKVAMDVYPFEPAEFNWLNVKVTMFDFRTLLGGDKFRLEGVHHIEKRYKSSYTGPIPIVGDFNGDKCSDILNVFYQDECMSDLVYLFKNDYNGTLNTIKDSDEELKITYALPSSGDDFYEEGTSEAFPLLTASLPVNLVKSVEKKLTSSLSTTNIYSYKGLIVHQQGLGVLGFQETSVKRTNTNMGQTNYFTYLTSRSALYCSKIETFLETNGQLDILAETTMGIAEKEIDPNNDRFFLYTPIKTSINHKKGSTSIKNVEVDNYGNNELTTITIKDGATTVFTSVTDPTIEINTTNNNWIPGRATAVTSTVSRPGEANIVRNTSYEYYTNGRLENKITEPDDTKMLVENYLYDAYGNLNKITTSAPNDLSIPLALRSRTKVINYSDDGRFASEVVNDLGHQTHMFYDETTGALLSNIDANQLQSFYKYNALGLNNLSIAPDGTCTYNVLKWVQPNDDDAPEGALYVSESKSTLNKVVRSYYGKTGLLRTIVQKEFESRSGKEIVYIDYKYTALGQMFQQSVPYYKGETDENILWTVYDYDNYGRIKTFTGIDGTVTTYIYNDSERKITVSICKEGKTLSSTKKYNALGELIESIDSENKVVQYSYYSNGLLKSTGVQGTNVTITMQYDLFGNKTLLTDPSAGATTYIYNAFGETVSITNARGLKTSFEYDILGRATKKTVQNGSTTNYTYDTQWLGAVSTISSSNNITTSFTYDDLGRQIKYSENVGGKEMSTQYAYDNYGRLSSYIYPSGFTLDYTYQDGSTELLQISEKGNNVPIWQAGLKDKLMMYESYGLGQLGNVVLTHDQQGRLTRKFLNTYYDYNVGYDNAGNIDERRDDLHQNKETFLYDDLHRLTSITTYHNNAVVGGRTFNYDDFANLSEQTGPALSYSTTNQNQLETVSGVNLEVKYNSLVYDTENNLTTISNATKTLEMIYGSDKLRRKAQMKEGSQVIKTTYYHQNYEEEITSGNTRKIHYISAPTGMAAIHVMDNQGNATYYTLTDHLGSLNTVIDEAGIIVQEQAFDAWGKPREAQNWGNVASFNSTISNRGFTMHEHLPDFNLIHMNGRVYCPTTMQFLSPDPFVQAPDISQNHNRYSYCLNNPLGFTDPSGYAYTSQSLADEIEELMNTPHGGIGSGGNGGYVTPFLSQEEALDAGMAYNDLHDSWGNTAWKSRDLTVQAFHAFHSQNQNGSKTGYIVYKGERFFFKQYNGKFYLPNSNVVVLDPVAQMEKDWASINSVGAAGGDAKSSGGENLQPTIKTRWSDKYRQGYFTVEVFKEVVTQKGNSGISVSIDNDSKAKVAWSRKLPIGQVGATGTSLTIGTQNVQVGSNLNGVYSLSLDFGGHGMTIDFDLKGFGEYLGNSVGYGLANPAFNPMYCLPAPRMGIIIPL